MFLHSHTQFCFCSWTFVFFSWTSVRQSCSCLSGASKICWSLTTSLYNLVHLSSADPHTQFLLMLINGSILYEGNRLHLSGFNCNDACLTPTYFRRLPLLKAFFFFFRFCLLFTACLHEALSQIKVNWWKHLSGNILETRFHRLACHSTCHRFLKTWITDLRKHDKWHYRKSNK